MSITTYLSTITLNVNGLNVLIKRHTVAQWITKKEFYICCLQKTHFRWKDIHRLKGIEIVYKNGNGGKKRWDSNIYTTQNRLENKGLLMFC